MQDTRTKEKYIYIGAVLHFDRVMDSRWHGETMAFSEKQAVANLCYQFRKKNNLADKSRIRLEGKPVRADG